MKKITVFLLGVLTGIILTFVVCIIITNRGNKNFVMFDEPGKVMEQSSYKVFQSFNDGTALASDYSHGYSGALTVLLRTTSNEMYYDDQIVSAPDNALFKQVGLYTYRSQSGRKTVPIVTCYYK